MYVCNGDNVVCPTLFAQPVATPLMTPMMTPSSLMAPGGHMTTPVGGPAATPSYQPTPRSVWPGATPRTPATRTPATRTPAMVSRTPANAPTPVVRTPSRTPRTAASPAVGKSGALGIAGVGTDWARAAELWAKQRQTEMADLGGTPRGSTPGGTPRGTPRGSTPGGTPRGGTPRSTPRSKSPRVSGSPAPVASTSYDRYGGDSPQGDGTPLIDER